MRFKLWVENQALPIMYHGSPKPLNVLQPGSMLTSDPMWAIGYTTQSDFGINEKIVGFLHIAKVKTDNDYLIPGSLHDAESFLINYAKKYGLGQGGGLTGIAKKVHEKTQWDALTASFRGTIVGAITLIEIPVIEKISAIEFLQSQQDIPDWIKKALERTN